MDSNREARPYPWGLVNCRRDSKIRNSRALTARIAKSAPTIAYS